jgi:FixJ family two-component response regulator
MPMTPSQRAVVHVVDDDASMRRALHGLFDSVGLETRTYATAGDFLSRASKTGPDASSLMSACPT